MQPRDRKPAEPPAAETRAAEGEPTPRQPREKPSVLVVDDDHLVRAMVQLGLERNGFDVWLAPSGREAIDLYREHRKHITVILLEVCLPGLDGPQTLAALRELNPEILVCFMSGNRGDYDCRELLRRGAAQVIAKPFHLDQLATVLRRLVQGGACPSSPIRPGMPGMNRERAPHGDGAGQEKPPPARKSGEL
jgi:CheY-like chemotaxis protein